MEIIISFSLLVLGFVFVIKGSDFLVEGSSSLAKRFNISELAIGLTVVSFGTSAPELAVNTQANSAMIFGNIIGSNIFNTMAILGVAGLIYPLKVARKTVWREIPLSLLAVVVLFVLTNDALLFGAADNKLSLTDATLLLAGFGGFIFYVFLNSKSDILEDMGSLQILSMPKTMIYIVVGILALVGGGRLVVSSAIDIATFFQVSETLISLTIVSMGTSLPELATSAVAAYKKKSDIAVGNVIGSNIFNIFLILGVSALIKPIDYQPFLNMDILILVGATVLLFLSMFTRKSGVLDRIEAFILLAGFVAYMTFILYRNA